MGALTLRPAGTQATAVADLTWILLWGSGAILLLVLVLLAIALRGPERWRRALRTRKLILWGGLAFPTVVLAVLLVVGLSMTASLNRPPADDAYVMRVTGYRWWWRVDHPGAVSANEIVIPAGRPVVLELASADVIHNVWIPELAGKRDMIPGRINRLTIQAAAPGRFFGICAEYCGGPHALMQLPVRALAPAEWEAWLANERRPAATPATPIAQRGSELFQQLGCGSCHRVAGTAAGGAGRPGPDLTHVAGRTTLGAGILPNGREQLAGWTRNPHRFKPGVNMPAFNHLPPAEIDALAAYMETLK